jgi:predicted kinase
MDALFYICKGEANTTLIEFERAKKSLQDVITHFGSIYSKKRSQVAERCAVETFVRQKGKLLEICLQRYDLVVDKIRHLHSDSAWPEVRQGLKRAKLMQIIADDMQAYIQNKEDDAIESTGMPYDFKKLVKMASRYKRQHNKLPDKNIQTIFTTSLQLGLPRGKKKQKEFIEQVVQEDLQLNPLATRASSTKRVRDNIRANRDDSRSSQRQSRFDQNRSLSQDEFFTLSSPNTQNSQNPADASFTQSQPRSVFSQKCSQRPFQSASRSRSPSPFQRQNSQNVGDRTNYQLRDRSNESISQIPRQSQASQPFSGITPAQRVEPSATRSEEPNCSSYNSEIDRLRSQNSLFNSGEMRNYRDRQSSAECNYDNQQRYQSRSFSPRRPYNRDLSRDRQDNYYYRHPPPWL